jgi:hypothetical protein
VRNVQKANNKKILIDLFISLKIKFWGFTEKKNGLIIQVMLKVGFLPNLFCSSFSNGHGQIDPQAANFDSQN